MPGKISKNKKKTLRERKQRTDALRDAISDVRREENMIEEQTQAKDAELFFVDKPKIVSLDKVNHQLVRERRKEKLKNFKDSLEKELAITKARTITRPLVKIPKTDYADTDEKRMVRNEAIRLKAEAKELASKSKPVEVASSTPKLLSFWSSGPQKVKKINRASVAVPMPLTGQSYNPSKSAHKHTLDLAYKGEKRLIDVFDDTEASLKRRLNEDAGAGGDDILDGLVSQNREVEPQDASEIEKPPTVIPRKPKLSKSKALNKKKHERELQNKNKRIEKANQPNVKDVAKRIRDRFEQREEERDERKARKKQKLMKSLSELTAPVASAKDIMLEDELPNRLASMDGNGFYLWQERLRNYHNTKLMTVKSLSKGNLRVDNQIVF